jgi:hypothetical protein
MTAPHHPNYPADTRGTRTPSTKTLLRRANKAEQHRLEIDSARSAGYRRGQDDKERELNIKHDNEINRMRNEMACVAEETIVLMDREITKGWLAVVAHHNQTHPDAEIIVSSARTINCVARELSRAYAKEQA